MSNQLESALVLELVDTIKWGAALKPATDGSLTYVDLDKPLDVTKYSRRDRELAYRDLVNATAVLKVALHVESVWNTESLKPKLQGITGDDYLGLGYDLHSVDSTVVHVKNSSLPYDALATDGDLAGRDALIYEVLSKACEIFDSPPITSPGTGVVGTTAWSLASGADYGIQPSASLPLNTNAFYLADATLAQRDNFVAAYAARLCQVIQNPFEFANRLYVRVDGTDARDSEAYTLVRKYYSIGTVYSSGDEVFYITKLYRATKITTNLPTVTTDWVEISSTRYREWTAEPALPLRNRIVYDTVSKTLQWFRETTDIGHIPQIYAMSIPGMFIGQTITTLAQAPERKDCQYWRQKAARIDYSGTSSALAYAYDDTSVIGSGVTMTDTAGLTYPSTMAVPIGAVTGGSKYRLAALVKPTQTFSLHGNRNDLGLTGTDEGVTFSGIYAPTTLVAGEAVTFPLSLPVGTWYLSIEYTNLSGTTAGFGMQIMFGDAVVTDDTSPLLFQDSTGSPLEAGTAVQSMEWRVNSTGTPEQLKFIWTRGSGSFQINTLTLRTSDNYEGEYLLRMDVKSSAGDSILTDKPTVESTGRKNIYEVVSFDFTPTSSDASATAHISWLATAELPIEIRKISLSEVYTTAATPGVAGFDSFKWECLRRAEKSIQTAFGDSVRTTTGTYSDFTSDGTQWDHTSTDAWMAYIEAREPRLRVLNNVETVRGGFQYTVDGGYVVYNDGTYNSGELFNGTSTDSAWFSYGASVNQVGAFKKSTPDDLGQPALMPRNLRFDEANSLIRMDNDLPKQVPTVVACQPWMIEAGLYSADEDFRYPDIVGPVNYISAPTSAAVVEPPVPPPSITITLAIDPALSGTASGGGLFYPTDSATLFAFPSSAGGSSSTYSDWGVDVAIILDESGSMGSYATRLKSIFEGLEAQLAAAGIGSGAVPNKYGVIGFGSTLAGHYINGSGGHLDINFGSYATLSSFMDGFSAPARFEGGNEDGYEAMSFALGGLAWRASANVVKIMILITDEDRTYDYYGVGGSGYAAQRTAIMSELSTAGVRLVTLTPTVIHDSGANEVLGVKYGGKTYQSNNSGGYTMGTGGVTVSGYDTFDLHPLLELAGGASTKEEYADLGLNVALQGQAWNLTRLLYGASRTTESFQRAMAAALAEDIVFTVTTSWYWSFVGWYDESNTLLSTSTPYSFATTASQTITARFVHT